MSANKTNKRESKDLKAVQPIEPENGSESRLGLTNSRDTHSKNSGWNPDFWEL